MVFFIDVVAAFASMLRRIIFDIDVGDEAWLHKLRDNGYFDEDVDILIFILIYIFLLLMTCLLI